MHGYFTTPGRNGPMGCMKSMKHMATVGTLLLAAFLLKGCATKMAMEEINHASGPYCDSLAGYWSIKDAWETEDGTLAMCVNGIPSRAVENIGPPDREKSRNYTVAIPGDILYRRHKIEEWRTSTHKIVKIPPTATSISCPDWKPGWKEVPIYELDENDWDKVRRLNRHAEVYGLDQSTTAIFLHAKTNYSWPKYYEGILVRRPGSGISRERMVSYQPTPRTGQPTGEQGVMLALSMLFDAATIALEIQNGDEQPDYPRRSRECLM